MISPVPGSSSASCSSVSSACFVRTTRSSATLGLSRGADELDHQLPPEPDPWRHAALAAPRGRREQLPAPLRLPAGVLRPSRRARLLKAGSGERSLTVTTASALALAAS